MKLRLKTLDLDRTPIEMIVFPDPRNKGVKAIFDKNGVAEVPDRIGVILLKDNQAYERMPDDYGVVTPTPEVKKDRKPRAEETKQSKDGAEVDKADFVSQMR